MYRAYRNILDTIAFLCLSYL